VVSGATSTGKTSLVGALLGTLAPTERLVVVEDTTELPLRHGHVVRLEARPAAVDGPPAIGLAQLVRTALRLRPDRIVVGEVRGDEVLALVQAMNTGHDGSISTCHANGPLDALLRLESLVMQAAPTWPLAAIRHHLARSIDVIVHVDRRGREREVAAISELAPVTAHDSGDRLRELASRDDGAVGALTRRRR
jgi:pilus assembly protein CpaF